MTGDVKDLFTPGDRVGCSRKTVLGTVIHLGESLVQVEWDDGATEWHSFLELGIKEYSRVRFPIVRNDRVQRRNKLGCMGTCLANTLHSNKCEVEWDNGTRSWEEFETLRKV